MDERLEKVVAGNEKLAELVSEIEKLGIKIVVTDKVEEEPKPITPVDMANMVEFMDIPRIPVVSPSGQENRRKRREMERKNKKRKK